MNLKVQQSFFDDHQARFSPETIRSYRIALNQFFTFCDKPYAEVKAGDIRGWLASLEGQGMKPRSIHLKLTKIVLSVLHGRKPGQKNPTFFVRTPKKDDSLPYYLNKRQVALQQELTKGDPRDRAMVETLYATGVRVSELLAIKVEDIKWETRQIWIRKGKGNKERFVLFTHDCAERLRTYLDNRKEVSPYLFPNNRGSHLSRVFVERKFQEFSETLGFKVLPHTMRHTFAAHLAEKNMRK